MRPQDVIVGFGTNPSPPTTTLLDLLDQSAISRDAELRVLRNNRELTLTVRPQEQTE